MAGNNGKKNDFQTFIEFLKSTITALATAAKNEFKTATGKTNLLLDVLLLVGVLFMASATGLSTIVRMVLSIWNHDLTRDTGDSTLITMLIILIAFWVVCLILQVIIEGEWKKRNKGEQ